MQLNFLDDMKYLLVKHSAQSDAYKYMFLSLLFNLLLSECFDQCVLKHCHPYLLTLLSGFVFTISSFYLLLGNRLVIWGN